MKKQDYTTSISVPVSAPAAYNRINDVAAWWSDKMEGQSKKLNDVFTVHFGETNITIKITELAPGKKIGWEVIDCYKHWLKDKKEWKGTTMLWEILPTTKDTASINFTHNGLVPGMECYNGCEKAWNHYIKESLFEPVANG